MPIPFVWVAEASSFHEVGEGLNPLVCSVNRCLPAAVGQSSGLKKKKKKGLLTFLKSQCLKGCSCATKNLYF